MIISVKLLETILSGITEKIMYKIYGRIDFAKISK